MDMLPTSVIFTVELSLKVIVVIAAMIIFAFNFFQAKEAKKMERKLNVGLPGSVSILMSFQTVISFAFMLLAVIFLFA